ncbi:hypothetical protein JCM24511_10201 [Saitozyma sp. JCM 24511]|nr:hypothetical protein JCM24511_10201 [Saitozyma sp. JCM 24511]
MSALMASDVQCDSWEVFGVVTFYIVAAITMVTVNKWILLATPTPIFFLFCQLAISVILLFGCHQRRLFILPSFHWTVARKLSPLVVINVLGLTFNAICLQYVDASFYQVARGLVLPMAVGLAFATGQLPPSPRALVCCVVVTVGYFVGILFEQNGRADHKAPSSIGLLFGILSSCTTAIHSIVIKSSLGVVDDSTISLAWYANLLSTIVIFPFILVAGELQPILHMLATPEELKTFLIGTALTGVFGFLICIAGFLSIKVTSPVTHMISAAARGIIQTALGVLLFHDILSKARTSSIVVITMGSCAYARIKYEETLEVREQEHRYGLALDAEEVYGEQGAIEIDKPTGLIRKPEEV